MELTNVFHAGRIYEGTKRFAADDKISEIKSQCDYPMILSYYKEFDSDEIWISVVNAHQKLSDTFNVYFQNGVTESFYLAPGQMKLIRYNDIVERGKQDLAKKRRA